MRKYGSRLEIGGVLHLRLLVKTRMLCRGNSKTVVGYLRDHVDFSLRDGVYITAAGLKSIRVRRRGKTPLPVLDELRGEALQSAGGQAVENGLG